MNIQLKISVLFSFIILFNGVKKAQNTSSSVFWVDEDKQEIGFTDLSTNANTTLVKGPGDLNFLYDIAVDSTAGDVYFVTNRELRVGDPASNSAETLHEFGESNIGFRQLTFDVETNAAFLTDGENRIVYKYDVASANMESIITGEDFEGNPWG